MRNVETIDNGKESRGCLGVLAMCQALYRATANESFEMVDYISKL